MGLLPAERKWGPAMGFVDGVLTIAGGGDYGDDSMDVFDGGDILQGHLDII